MKVESGLVVGEVVEGEGAEVRARPHPQAEDGLQLKVCQLRSVLGTLKLKAAANKAPFQYVHLRWS